jgi:thiol-disulfide isomerase/thioredoxin
MKAFFPTLALSLTLILLSTDHSSAGAFNNLFDGKLIKITDGKIKMVPKGALAKKKIFAFYYSADWCPPCHVFTPELNSEYVKLRAQYPEFELIFVSRDRSEKDMKEYMASAKMPYPAIEYEKLKRLDQINRLASQGFPYLLVTDANGKELIGKGREDWADPYEVLPQLKSLLQKAP